MSDVLEIAKSSRPRAAIKAPTPKAPLLNASKMSPSMGMMADIINNAAAPFQEDPDPKKGDAGEVEHYIGMAMGVIGAPFELLDTGFALVTAPLAALMPGFPAAVLFMPHLGTLHGHAHPPSLIPPNPVPTPLPSIGTVLTAGCVSVLIGGVPAARAGDLGLAITCFSFGPPFEIYTGSSNTWIGGSRAARMLDITRHCNPASKLGLLGAAMGAVGVIAGAVGSQASSNAGDALQASMQAAQAAADAVALAMSALIGIDPGVPPSIGAVMLGNPTVLIGGFPVPDLLDLLGGALKGLKKIGDKIGNSPAFKKLIAKVGLCNDKGEPVSSFTGAVYNDFDDYRAPSGFSWERHYKSSWNLDDGPLGHGFRHVFERRLELLRKRAVYESHDGERVAFPRDEKGRYIGGQGYSFERLATGRYLLSTDRDEKLEFDEQPTFPPSGRLVRYQRARLELLLAYDQQGRLRTITEPGGAFPIETRLIYDADNRIVEVHRAPRDTTPQIISRYAYENGCLVAWQDALGATARMRYDEARRMVQGTDRRGYSFYWQYDPASGRCIKAHGEDGLWGIEARYEGDTSYFKEADGGEWTFKHFPDGVVSHVIDPLDGVLEYVRDKETGRIVKQVLPGGTEFRWQYDRKGKHYARADQWAHQFLPEDLDPEPRDPLAHDGPLTHKAWLWGRPLEQLSVPLAGLPSVISHVLERLGPYTLERPQPRPDPVRDALGRILEQTERDGKVRRFRRDAEGNVVAEQDIYGNWSRRDVTSWNLLGAETSALGNTTRFTYTHWEKWRSIVDPNGNRTEYVRDSLHRVHELHRHGGLYRRYAYEAHDALLTERDGAGTTLASYTVAPNGLHASCSLASGETYTYEYDTHGRPTRASSSEHEVTLAHLRNLRTLDQRDGKGVEHAYECWLSVLRTRYFGQFVVQYRYQGAPGVRIRTPDGNEHRVWRTSRGLVVRENANRTSEATVFDHEQRLCSRVCWNKDRTLQGPTWMQRFSYSAHGELLSWSDSERDPISFEYDLDHRLIAQTDHRGRRPYEYDHAGNLIRTPERQLIEYNAGNLIDHADFDHFEYDDCHRIIKVLRFQRPEVTYRYDSKGQLVEARFSDRPEIWRATYDGLGRRLWKEYAGARTDFYWDGDRLAAERFPDGKLRLYIYVNEDAIIPFMWIDYASEDADPASGKACYIFAAPNGMPLRVEDADRDVVWQLQSIDAYGKIEIAPRAKVDLRLRFAGHFYDEHLDLFYNRFRDYDPSLGRYLQPDPIGHEGGINLYSYPPNPLVDVDLRGLMHRKGPPGEGPEQTKALKDAVKEDVETQQKTLPSKRARKKALMVGGARNKKTGDIETATNAEAAAAGRGDLHRVVRARVDAQDAIADVHRDLRRGKPPDVPGKTTQEIHDMTPEERRKALEERGVPAEVEGMDTADQLDRTNDRAKMREDQLGRDMTDKDYSDLKDENGTHGEIKATSDSLKRIEMDPPEGQGRDATATDIEDLEIHNQRIPDEATDPVGDDPFQRCDICRGTTEGAQPTPDLAAKESAVDQDIAKRWGE